MSEISASSGRAGHRYNWCPGCGELWLAGWMAAAGVDRCPSCDRHVLAYVGRTPYDAGQASPHDEPDRTRPRQAPEVAVWPSRAAVPREAMAWRR